VFDQVGAAMITETGRQPLDQPDRLVGSTQKQHAGIRGHRSTVERGNDPRPSTVPKSKLSGLYSVGIEAASWVGTLTTPAASMRRAP
jgi:hypothetical protein